MHLKPDDLPRYIEWNFETHVAREYERMGDCNGCGACCRAMITFVASSRKNILKDLIQYQPNSDWATYDIDQIRFDTDPDPRNGLCGTDEKGIWNEISLRGERRFFKFTGIVPEQHACTALTADVKCQIHFDKALICQAWPLAPQQVTPFPDCSYSFVQIRQWEFVDAYENELAQTILSDDIGNVELIKTELQSYTEYFGE